VAKLAFKVGDLQVFVSNIADSVDLILSDGDESVVLTWGQLLEIERIMREKWFRGHA
jgi:hypothetical protein